MFREHQGPTLSTHSSQLHQGRGGSVPEQSLDLLGKEAKETAKAVGLHQGKGGIALHHTEV